MYVSKDTMTKKRSGFTGFKDCGIILDTFYEDWM
jgi:hypothetical protein